ncbi:hypothetical protein TL16_g01770 [Triparma laevis f. inornata]|uniref:SRCR domain-containing protein n=1 Tax=Triparma laevis f. inornata TaxID=1714386 RepID=A0A9W6ZQR0_9STRA|nr:hypothetical protein TL16_g01770 [Triparma laevis f. inornata]
MEDGIKVRIRPKAIFDSEGVVSGRIEVKWEGVWGTIYKWGWDDLDAKVGCRQLGNELGYITISGTALDADDTPDGSGKQWWRNVDCAGNEEMLERCYRVNVWSSGHDGDIGITCKFVETGQCETCPSGKFSDTVDPSFCTDCEAGKHSPYTSATSADTCVGNICERCEAGKASAAGATKCTVCPGGLVLADASACQTRKCEIDEFNHNGECEKCNNLMSTTILAGSFISFVVAAWYSTAIATDRKKMMQLKVATTFFQTAELTTLINVSWPAIVFFTLPFQLPITDTKCLAASSGWNQVSTFYAYIYGPIFVFSVPLLSASGTQPSSTERKKAAGLLIVLVSLWYSPLLQTIASMYECFQDPERENKWYLRSDASVSCEPSLEKTIVNIHVLAFSALVGVGFPLFSFLKIRSLRKASKLDFDSSFANLFQFYNTRMPYFETAQFSRKGLLIFVLTLSADNPVVQAVLSLGINGGFLILLIWTRPFVYYPTSHSKRDLFQIAEVSSTVTCLIGNTLALIGSLKMSDQSYIDVLGGVLATTNIAYFILLMFKYRAEVTRSAKKEAAWALQVKRYKKNRNLGGELLKALGEWHTLVMSLEDNNLDERRRLQIVDEMPFAKSRIVADMRIMLMKVEEKHWMNLTHQISETFNEESFKQKCRRCQRALNPVNDDFEKVRVTRSVAASNVHF